MLYSACWIHLLTIMDTKEYILAKYYFIHLLKS